MMFYKPNRTTWGLGPFLPSVHSFLPVTRVVKVTQSIMFGQVIFGGTPFKVFNSGICPVFVNMVNDRVIVGIGNKCLCHDSVQGFGIYFPIPYKANKQISVCKNNGSYDPSRLCVSYPGQVANFVPSFKPFDGFPDFIHLANINMMPIKRK